MKMQGPENSGGLTVGTKLYEPDADGQVEIDSDHVVHALAHGFTPAEDDRPAKKKTGSGKA